MQICCAWGGLQPDANVLCSPHSICLCPPPPSVENSLSLAEALRAIMMSRREQANFQLIIITHDERFAHTVRPQ